ncbi:unnamed protein product [Adineta steineri]|uniref:Uncharacterized protein n=1 Tax=Adineta steineri TaxID=433720 RepID=A0A815JPB7_9BILA|nr:unnamed protein product [Adineta steineri]CAF1382438.1 unnamed protein product [Adineta steineri]
MASLSEQKYTTLRKRLDQFGFKQPLAIESLPLVEKLFQAFIQTTEELKKAKENAPTHSQPSAAPLPSSQSSTTLSSAHPYKNDNARLVKENNDLHLELIKCREQLDHHVKDFKSQLRKLEHENADLRFLNTQYIHRLRSLEKESRQKDNKILELQEKNFQAVVQTPGGNKHTIPFRRQRLDIDEMLPESSSSTQRTSAQQLPYVNDPYIIDIVKVTEDRIAELELELQQQKQYVDEVETKMANLKYQVENRDREIERLHRVLDGGRSSDTLSLESRLRSNDKVIANQSAQIDFLHETNRALERRLQEVTELKRTLSDKQFEERLKASDLVRDLKDIDRLARKVQADKDFTVETADRELNEAKIEIQYNHREMQSLDTKVACLATEKKNLLEELEAARNQCGERENEIIRIQTLLERTQADKAKLSRQVSKLVLNEKDLLQELQKCRRTTKAPTPTVSGASSTKKLSLPARLDIHLKNVEDERNMYKAETETLQKLLSERLRGASSSSSPSASRLRGRSLSPTPGARTTGRRDIATSPVMQLGRRSGSNGSTSPTRCTVCGINRHRSSPTKDLTAFENQLRNVEEERDRFRRELNKHKRSSKDMDEPQLAKVIREKEDLQLLLNKFERHMGEIQGNIKVLTNERDNISVLYEQAKEELQRARHDILQSVQTPKVSLAAQSILRKVESERDAALIEARTSANERDTIRERLRVATDTNLTERARLEQRIEDLQIEIRKLDNDREDILQQNHLLREQIKDYESKVDEQLFTISQLNQELNDQKTTSSQLRFLSEEAERLVQENQRQLNLKKEELRVQEEKTHRLEKKLYDTQEMNKGIKDDFHVVRSTVHTLDKEKDRLCGELDLKAEENLHLIQELNSKTRRIEELSMMIAELEAALDRTKDDTKQKLKEITSMRMQLDRNLEELNEYRRKLDLGVRDNKRLQDDLLTVTRENQTLHQELEHAIDDKENLKLQVQEYIKEVSKCENVISQKENDRTSLFEQYREATNELSRAKLTLADIESQAANLRQELHIKSADMKRLAERTDYLERELQQHISVNHEYEIQLSNMNRSIQRNEEIIKRLQIEKQNYATEISNVRDLNSTVENKKEHIIRELTGREIENEQLQAAISDMKLEIDMLHTQINNEKAMVRSLEEIIGSSREKEFQSQVQAQEKDSDLQLAKERANMTDVKIQSQGKEIAALRAQVIGLESDNDRLKRQLTSERFEREKAAQDLRKLTDLTSNIEYDSRYRSTSPRVTPSVSATNNYRSSTRNYSPSRSEHPQTSPTKGIDRSCSLCVDTTP